MNNGSTRFALPSNTPWAGENKPGVSIELNENACRLLTWEKLEVNWPLRVEFHTPIGNTVCHGRVTDSTPLGGNGLPGIFVQC